MAPAKRQPLKTLRKLRQSPMSDQIAATEKVAKAASIEIVAPDSTAALLQEVLDETTSVEREEAKKVIRRRIQEIKKTELLLEKMKEDLNKLLKKDPKEIAMQA